MNPFQGGFLNLSKVEVCSFDPGKEKTFVDPVDWDFGREFIDICFRSERCPL